MADDRATRETADPSRLATDRLLLRRPLAGDAAALLEIHDDPVANRFNPAGETPWSVSGVKRSA